jgi:hypothetical protein
MQEFYQCKSRHPRERKRRELVGMEPCGNRYMLRKKLEPKIDYLLGEKLREPSFLERVLDYYNDMHSAAPAPLDAERTTLGAKLAALRDRKNRIIEAFFEGVIDKNQRDSRLSEVNREIESYEQLLIDTVNPPLPLVAEDLSKCLEPFAEWEYLSRDDKRALLALICPPISVSRYTVKSIELNLGWLASSGDEGSRLKMATSPSPALHFL